MNQIDDTRTKRNVAVLVAAQAILGAQMPMLFVIGGLAGNMMSTNPCLATLPISMIVFGSMTTAPWLSPLMQRRGRRFGFVVGALGGAAGAAIALAGLWHVYYCREPRWIVPFLRIGFAKIWTAADRQQRPNPYPR